MADIAAGGMSRSLCRAVRYAGSTPPGSDAYETTALSMKIYFACEINLMDDRLSIELEGVTVRVELVASRRVVFFGTFGSSGDRVPRTVSFDDGTKIEE